MSNQYSAAIVGCGMIAGQFQDRADMQTYSHAKAIFDNPNFKHIGYFDINPEASSNLAKKFPGSSFGSLSEMIKEMQPDVVSLCSPDYCHYEQTIELLEHEHCPKIIFVEKPVCQNEAELTEIISRLRANGAVNLFVNHSRRFDSNHSELAKNIREGTFGQFNFCNVNYYGGWQHNGIHVLDFLHACFAGEIIVDSVNFACRSNYSDDPTLNLCGRLDGGKIVFKGHDEEFYQVTEIDLFFSEGRVVISNFGMKIEIFKKVINMENERVLEAVHATNKSMRNQMSNAYRQIAMYLESSELGDLNNVSIETAAIIMRNIWSVKRKYNEQKN